MAREGRWSLVAEMENLHGLESFWHSPLWPVFWTNTKAFKWEPWFCVSSPLTVLKVQTTAGIVCSAKVTHRPFEIGFHFVVTAILRHRISEASSPIPPVRCRSVSTEADPCAQTVLLAGSCKGSGLSKVTNSGVSRWWVIPRHQLWRGFFFGSSNSLGLSAKLDFCKVSSWDCEHSALRLQP